MTVPWKNKTIVKFLLPYLGIVLLLLVFFHIYSGMVVREFYISSAAKKMEQEARLVSRLLPTGIQGEALDTICRDLGRELGVRLTVISLDGRVLGDSDRTSATMDNHGDRPEIVAALSSGTGQSIRFSTTVGYEMLYQAVVLGQASAARIVRISVALEAVEKVIASLRKTIFAGLLAASALVLFLVIFLSNRLSRRVIRMAEFSDSVAQGEFPRDYLPTGKNDELSILERNLNATNLSIQEKIKESVAEKEKVESIVRCMVEGVVVVDNEGKVILLNENAKKMFQLPDGESFHGASLMEISRHPEMKRLMDDVLVAEAPREYSTREIRLDEGKWFRVNEVSLRDGDARALGHLLVFHDVSEIRRLENVRADFVANVSHELRTPLTAIRGYAETLLRTPPSNRDERDQFLQIIYRHSERLGRLIDDLLTLSDLELGKVQLAREKVPAANLIASSLELFKEQAEKKQITVSQTVQPQDLSLLGDADRLQELLINLIDNAIKYTPPGGSVKVAARMGPGSESPSDPMIELAVSDTGCGIPQKDLPRLTERFYRVDKARSRELGGTGLGLAIVKHITQAHSGYLKIDSEWQKGTTIAVYLRPYEAPGEAANPVDPEA